MRTRVKVFSAAIGLVWLAVSLLVSIPTLHASKTVGRKHHAGGTHKSASESCENDTAALIPPNHPFFAENSTLRAVVVLTTQRSGSGWVLRMMETKSPPIDFRNKEPFGLLQRPKRDAQCFKQQMYTVFSERCDNPTRLACGFKMMYNQVLSIPVFFEFLQTYRDRISVVHLVRRNVLRRLISLHYLHLDHSRSQVSISQAMDLSKTGSWKQEPFDFQDSDFSKLKGYVDDVSVWGCDGVAVTCT